MKKLLFLLLLIPALANATVTTSFTANASGTTLSGVAPLAVYWDGTASTSDVFTTASTAFAGILCETNFGDPNGSPVLGKYWTNGYGYNTNRNYATGVVSAHVYEVAGTYTISTICGDGAGIVGTSATATITVTDPETVFASNTACVSSSGTPVAGVGGCPAGAALLLNQGVFETALTTTLGANGCGVGVPCRRVLFKKGDAFTGAAKYTISIAGPGILGAYGTGANPQITEATNLGGEYISPASGSNNWRIMDLTFIGQSTFTTTQLISIPAAATVSGLTVLRVTENNFLDGVNVNNTVSAPFLAVFDSTMLAGPGQGAGNYCVFQGGTAGPLMVLGNYMSAGTVTAGHTIRLSPSSLVGVVIAHNTIYNGGATNLAIRGNSSYANVSDNKFIGGTATSLIWFGPQNTTSTEYIHDIIFERNLVVAGASGAGGITTGDMSYSTIRTNIFDDSACTSTCKAMDMSYDNTRGAPVPTGNNFYNNIVYNGGNANFSTVRIFATTSPVFIAGAGSGTSTMTITSVTSGNVAPGGTISGGGLSAGATILSYGTFTNVAGTGTVNLDSSPTWANGGSVTEITTVTNTTLKNNLVYSPNSTHDGSSGGTQATFIVNAGINTIGASGTLGNSSDAQIKNTNPFTVTPSTLLDFRKTIAAVCDGTTNSPQDLWPSSHRDFLNCGPKIGANICAGAMVPAANAMCFGAAQ